MPATAAPPSDPLDSAAGRRVWAIEGTGSYGAGLARFLIKRGEVVLEVSRAPRPQRRLQGKDDALDARDNCPAAVHALVPGSYTSAVAR